MDTNGTRIPIPNLPRTIFERIRPGVIVNDVSFINIDPFGYDITTYKDYRYLFLDVSDIVRPSDDIPLAGVVPKVFYVVDREHVDEYGYITGVEFTIVGFNTILGNCNQRLLLWIDSYASARANSDELVKSLHECSLLWSKYYRHILYSDDPALHHRVITNIQQ